jgi:hypothetical protein
LACQHCGDCSIQRPASEAARPLGLGRKPLSQPDQVRGPISKQPAPRVRDKFIGGNDDKGEPVFWNLGFLAIVIDSSLVAAAHTANGLPAVEKWHSLGMLSLVVLDDER